MTLDIAIAFLSIAALLIIAAIVLIFAIRIMLDKEE